MRRKDNKTSHHQIPIGLQVETNGRVGPDRQVPGMGGAHSPHASWLLLSLGGWQVHFRDSIFLTIWQTNGLTDRLTDLTGPFQGPKHERSNVVKDIEDKESFDWYSVYVSLSPSTIGTSGVGGRRASVQELCWSTSNYPSISLSIAKRRNWEGSAMRNFQ
jgi:hypothetical protein